MLTMVGLKAFFGKIELKWVAIILITVIVGFGSYKMFNVVQNAARLEVQVENLDSLLKRQAVEFEKLIKDTEKLIRITEENSLEVSKLREEAQVTIDSFKTLEGQVEASPVLKEAISKIRR